MLSRETQGGVIFGESPAYNDITEIIGTGKIVRKRNALCERKGPSPVENYTLQAGIQGGTNQADMEKLTKRKGCIYEREEKNILN